MSEGIPLAAPVEGATIEVAVAIPGGGGCGSTAPCGGGGADCGYICCC